MMEHLKELVVGPNDAPHPAWVQGVIILCFAIVLFLLVRAGITFADTALGPLRQEPAPGELTVPESTSGF